MSVRTICVVTGSRAEYGLLLPLMKEIEADPALALRLVVTGSHLSPRFGETWRAIAADGFAIDAKVDLRLDDDSAVGVARSMALALTGMAEALERLRPDIVVVLGDRYEMLAVAEAALLARIPLAHIHGGEASEGAMDDSIRHAITKLAHLHFTAAADYRRRVVQLGEAPERVFEVGAMGIDCLAALSLLDRTATARSLGLPPDRPFFVVTYHPVTLGGGDPAVGVAALRGALAGFPDHQVVVTGVNADPGRDRVAAAIAAWVQAEAGRVVAADSLGQLRYFSALRWAAAVVGNSSSGIIEAPALGVPTVNMGSRQQGRIRADSVIDCPETEAAIHAAVSRALDPVFRARAAAAPYPFGTPGAAKRIATILREVSMDGLIIKRFHDLRGFDA